MGQVSTSTYSVSLYGMHMTRPQTSYVHGTVLITGEHNTRTHLGHVIKTSWYWSLRCWILCLTPGLLLACTKSRSKRTTTPQRSDCSEQYIETLHHIQCTWPLPWRHASRYNTHNAIVKVFEQICRNTKLVNRSCVWDKTFPSLLTTLDLT